MPWAGGSTAPTAAGNEFLGGGRSMRPRALLPHLPFSCVVRAGWSFTRRVISLFMS